MHQDYTIEPMPTNVGGWNPTTYANDMALKINHMITYIEYLQARVGKLELQINGSEMINLKEVNNG